MPPLWTTVTHKQSFGALKAQLTAHGIDAAKLWSDMHETVLHGVIAMHHSCVGDQRCFQLLGFDVLFDEDLQPHVLEVNVGLHCLWNLASWMHKSKAV